jgi:hypothetical protein
MIRINRDAIEVVKGTMISAIRGATNTSGLRIHVPMPSEDQLNKAVMLALQSLTMDLLGTTDIAIPSDVTHFTGFGAQTVQIDG